MFVKNRNFRKKSPKKTILRNTSKFLEKNYFIKFPRLTDKKNISQIQNFPIKILKIYEKFLLRFFLFEIRKILYVFLFFDYNFYYLFRISNLNFNYALIDTIFRKKSVSIRANVSIRENVTISYKKMSQKMTQNLEK